MGKVMMSGVAPNMKAPISGILASELAVGSVVKLMEGGVAVEYLVVNQGKPSGSSLYDDSCDGLWLLRKDIKEKRQWHSSKVNDYKNSTIHAWLNGDFFNQFGTIEQETIKQVKIPYANGSGQVGVTSGASGLSCKVFLPSAIEVINGALNEENLRYVIEDGARISYFTAKLDEADSKRVGYFNGTIVYWWLRSNVQNSPGTTDAWFISTNGALSTNTVSTSHGIRPIVILPSNALFKESNLLLKGVA